MEAVVDIVKPGSHIGHSASQIDAEFCSPAPVTDRIVLPSMGSMEAGQGRLEF